MKWYGKGRLAVLPSRKIDNKYKALFNQSSRIVNNSYKALLTRVKLIALYKRLLHVVQKCFNLKRFLYFR